MINKPNVVKGNSHYFTLDGHYYSDGNKGNFGFFNNYSAGHYVNRKWKIKEKIDVSFYNSNVKEKLVSQELSAGIDDVYTMIDQVRS